MPRSGETLPPEETSGTEFPATAPTFIPSDLVAPLNPKWLAMNLMYEGLITEAQMRTVAATTSITHAVEVLEHMNVDYHDSFLSSNVDDKVRQEANEGYVDQALRDKGVTSFKRTRESLLTMATTGLDPLTGRPTDDYGITDQANAIIESVSNAFDDIDAVNSTLGRQAYLVPSEFSQLDFANFYEDVLTNEDLYTPFGHSRQREWDNWRQQQNLNDPYRPNMLPNREIPTEFGGREAPGAYQELDEERMAVQAENETLRLEYIADQTYWKGQMQAPMYTIGDSIQTWAGLAPRTKRRLEGMMEDAGLLTEGSYISGAHGMPQIQAMQVAMHEGNIIGYGYEYALAEMAERGRRAASFAERDARPTGGRVSQPFAVPASLREIPDYESISQQTTNMFRQILGRDVEDYEVQILADHMQGQYRQANAEKITAARAAFNQARGGGSGIMEVEVPDPQLRTQRFIEDRYGNELDRLEDQADYAATNKIILEAITRGTSMVGR